MELKRRGIIARPAVRKISSPNNPSGICINHFFSDVTHFDGKFFITVKDLFAKPGFLSAEYMIGRRVRYLDPIRMYIFTSAIFFLIFFSLFDVQKMQINMDARDEIRKDPELKELLRRVGSASDSLNSAPELQKRKRTTYSVPAWTVQPMPNQRESTLICSMPTTERSLNMILHKKQHRLLNGMAGS